MQAAVGAAQIKKLGPFIAARKRNFARLLRGLREYEDYFVLPQAGRNSDPSWFGFPLSVRRSAPFGRDEVVRYLEARRIATRSLFAGNITRHPYFQGLPYRVYGGLENTDFVMNNSFWIGVHPGLTEEMVDFVLHCFALFVKENAPRAGPSGTSAGESNT
jgi:CDP-6-deoxy-D-xylo-4-hexulose-3-dehydrase